MKQEHEFSLAVVKLTIQNKSRDDLERLHFSTYLTLRRDSLILDSFLERSWGDIDDKLDSELLAQEVGLEISHRSRIKSLTDEELKSEIVAGYQELLKMRAEKHQKLAERWGISTVISHSPILPS